MNDTESISIRMSAAEVAKVDELCGEGVSSLGFRYSDGGVVRVAAAPPPRTALMKPLLPQPGGFEGLGLVGERLDCASPSRWRRL